MEKEEIKTIVFSQKTIEIKQKEKIKRQITQQSRWIPDVSIEKQLEIIQNRRCESSPEYQLIKKQIHQKIMGYKYQDIQNHLFSPTEFISLEQVFALLEECQLSCYYCQNRVLLLYSYVREPNQWTLERLDNQFGHNDKNVVISCLSCNLRRRTMYHTKFLYTKQIGKQNIIKLN